MCHNSTKCSCERPAETDKTHCWVFSLTNLSGIRSMFPRYFIILKYCNSLVFACYFVALFDLNAHSFVTLFYITYTIKNKINIQQNTQKRAKGAICTYRRIYRLPGVHVPNYTTSPFVQPGIISPLQYDKNKFYNDDVEFAIPTLLCLRNYWPLRNSFMEHTYYSQITKWESQANHFHSYSSHESFD